METYRFLSPLSRAAMRIAPGSVLQRGIDILMGRMRRAHPRLFKNLERLETARVRVEPSDVPHRFVLRFGKGGASLRVEDSEGDACIRGKLEALIGLLEGRADGDKLFFSRDLEITGNTHVVVALRNTLDREEIDLLEDVLALSGPFAPAARAAFSFADALARRVRTGVSAL